MYSKYDILMGIVIFIVGASAVIFNKYPGKKASYENAKLKFSSSNERKIAIFDGVFCMIFGLAYIKVEIIYLAALLIAYYPVRFMFLKFKYI